MSIAKLHHGARILLGCLFLAAGLIKLTDMPEFAVRVGDFGIVADGLVRTTAWLVVFAELVGGLSLLANVRGSLVFVVCLLALFCGVLVYGMSLGLDLDCGCFGPGYQVSLDTQLAIDLGLLCCCGFIYWSRKKCGSKTINPLGRKRSSA